MYCIVKIPSSWKFKAALTAICAWWIFLSSCIGFLHLFLHDRVRAFIPIPRFFFNLFKSGWSTCMAYHYHLLKVCRSATQHPRVIFLQMYLCFTNLGGGGGVEIERRWPRSFTRACFGLSFHSERISHLCFQKVTPLLPKSDTFTSWKLIGFLASPVTSQKAKQSTHITSYNLMPLS